MSGEPWALDWIAPWEWTALALGLGLVVGSFANVCIHRLPRRQSVVAPRSRCPACQRPIAALDNVPILSYLLLRGRCRACRAPISLRYPLVEAANGALYALLAALHGPTLRTAFLMVFATALLVLALIDLEHKLLPNVVTLPGVGVGLLASGLLGDPPGRAVAESAAAAAAGYLGFLLVAEGYRRLRGIEGLGQGDWKMAAMLGAFLGWQRLLLTVFLAALSGAAVGLALVALRRGDGRSELPLGTFLGFAGLVSLFVGDQLVAWYRALLHG
jgi:leader peptidase (prepilin peptidase)/N-methyltransferase